MSVQGYVDRHDFIIDMCRGRDVLDIGVVLAPRKSDEARRAFFSESLHMGIANMADKVLGIDLLEDEIEKLKRLFPELVLYSGDVENLSETLPEHEYEIVVMGDIIEHLSNPGRALEEIRTFLAPKGRLYITCPNAFGLPNYLRFIIGKFRESPDHVHAYTKYTMANLLLRHGYKCTGVWTCLDHRPSGTLKGAIYRLGTRFLSKFPEIGGTLIFEVQHESEGRRDAQGRHPSVSAESLHCFD